MAERTGKRARTAAVGGGRAGAGVGGAKAKSAGADVRHASGILPDHAIHALIKEGRIAASLPIEADQVQPASLDLRVGARVWRVLASFLPGAGTVQSRSKEFALHELDARDGAVLEKGCVYIAPLAERVRLPKRISAIANPKCSSGRLDVFTRLIADSVGAFDRLPAGYEGPLFAEISPRAFSIVVREGARLNQLRLRQGNPPTSDRAHRKLHGQEPLIAAGGAPDIQRGIALTVDLRGKGAGSAIGFRAKPHTGLIDMARIAAYDAHAFWEPVIADASGRLILNPGDFYILASRESVSVPPDHAAEMTAYDTMMGEFRVHYAGFFDPGFGHAEAGGQGSRAVLEVRSHEVPFVLDHGQMVGRLVYERLLQRPATLYGQKIGSSYQRQGLMLAKQFRMPA